jgi:uncharacterized membrane protein
MPLRDAMADPATEPRYLVHPPLIGVGAGLLIAAFVTDLMYQRSLLFQWNNFSMWLLLAGLLVALVAALGLVVDVLRGAVGAISWLRFGGFAAAALLSILNAFVHTRDAYTAVVPEGITLSAIVTVILLVLGWHGWSLRSMRRPHPSKAREARP